MRRRLIVIAAILGGAACHGADSPAGIYYCTDPPQPAVRVTVKDSLTGLSLASVTGTWARARDGTFVDSSGTPVTGGNGDPVVFELASDRKGTYAVTVHVPGYKDWTQTGVVVVQANQCYVGTVPLTALMASQ